MNLVVLGQTGSGKTTLVDSFVNYLLGVDFYDKFRYKLVDERALVATRVAIDNNASEQEKAKQAQIHSMTSKVTIYHIPQRLITNTISKEPCCVNIIDTPGFGDTRGPVWDNKISSMIGALLQELQTLDYILLTVKASDNRLSHASKFIYSKIQGLYADDLTERVVGMFTFSDGGDPQAFEAVKAAEIPMRERNRFRFNNSATWSKEIDDLTNQFWTLGMENFD